MLTPQHMLFNRDWSENGPGLAEYGEYRAAMAALSQGQATDVLQFVSGLDPSRFAGEIASVADHQVRNVLRYYVPPAKSFEQQIWSKQHVEM